MRYSRLARGAGCASCAQAAEASVYLQAQRCHDSAPAFEVAIDERGELRRRVGGNFHPLACDRAAHLRIMEDDPDLSGDAGYDSSVGATWGEQSVPSRHVVGAAGRKRNDDAHRPVWECIDGRSDGE